MSSCGILRPRAFALSSSCLTERIVSAIVKLGLQKGDTIYFTEAPDGMTPFDSEFEEWMETAERIMHRDADALKALAEL